MMFRTKQEVDRHAADLLRRVRDEKEKSSKGYQIAKLYHQIGEHEIGKRYLVAFLNVREAVPQAHKLMGQICESLKDYKRAISSYERCLQLNENQKDVVLKVCELLNQIVVDPGTIRYWVERAESMFPANEVIFNLKEKIVGAENEGDPTEMENLFKSELAKKPGNVRIHIKLLQLYINSKKVDAAIDYAISVDSLRIFDFNIEWYDYLTEFYACPLIANSIQQQTSSPNVYIQKMFVHCKQMLLWLQYKDVSDASQALHVFDQLLLTAATMDYRQPEWGGFLTEMKGFFFFFGGTLLFKRALKGQLTWKEAESLASLCYLVSENHQPVDKNSEWYLRGDGSKRLFLSHLHKMGSYRLSQGGHVLSEIGKKHSSNWVNDLRTRYGTPTGKERLYDLLFTFREMRNVRDKSFLLSDCGFSNMAATAVPSKVELAEYDASAHLLNPSDLNNIIWLCLHHFNSAKDESQPAYNFSLFDNLHYSSRNLSRGLHQGVESLCQLDMEGFLCCAVYCTSQQLQQVRPEPHQPHLLPRVLCRQFCTQEQADWWKLACKLGNKMETDNFVKMRLILMRGMDTVRLVSSHGISATLVTHLARTLQSRAAKMKKDVDNGHGSFNKLEELEERAAFYWEAALPLLQRLQKNLVLKMPKERLFAEDSDNRLDSSQIKEMLSDAEYHLALCFMRRGEHEEAIKRFENLTNPWASYHAAQIYRKLALNEHNGKGREEITSDNHSHYTVLLTKAREALYVTLDRLKGNKSHQLNLVISQDIDDIECLLTRVDIDNVVDGDSSGESFCSANSNGSADQSVEESYINDSNANRVSTPVKSHNCSKDLQKEQKKSPLATKHHTPKNYHGSSEGSHIRPSPERLDAQLRALQLSHSSILKPIVDQNKELTKLNVALQRDMRDLREQHQEMSNQLREMQELNRLYWAELSQYRMMSGGFPQGPPTPQAPPPSQAGPPQAGPPPQNLAAAYMNSPYRPPIQLTPQPPPWIASQYPGYQLPGTTPSASYRASSPKNLQNSRQSGMTPYSKMAAEDIHNAVEDEDDEDDEEEDPCHVDGEYYDESNNQSPNNFHIPDSQLVQEWPFGHQTGLVGKSTVTYSVQNRVPMPRAGYFADVLRGQTLQYGYHTSQSPIGRMPGPGYFSGNKGQSVMFTPPSTQITGTPPTQPPPLASALSGKSPVFQPSNSLSPLPPMPPNAVVGPTFAKPVASPAAVDTPQSFFQKMRGQTPFQLTMPPSTPGAGAPADSFTPAQSNTPCSGFTTPIQPPQSSSYDASFPQSWQGDKSTLSTPQIPAPQQVSGLPQSPILQSVSFAAKGCFVNYEGKSHMTIVRVVNCSDGKGVIVIALAADEKQLLLQQTITADLDIQITVFKNQQVSWCQPASCAKENTKLASKCSVEFEKVEDATNFKMTVNALRIKLSPVAPSISPGAATKPENTFPSTTTSAVSSASGSVSGAAKVSQTPVAQSPLAAALSSDQPATTSVLLKVLNQTSDAKSTLSSTPALSTSIQETPKGTKTFEGFTFTGTPKVDFDLNTNKSNTLMPKDSTDSTSETTSTSSAQKLFWNLSFPTTPTAAESVTSSPKPAVTNVSKNTNSNEKMGFMETKPSFNLFQSDKTLPNVGGKLFPSSSEGGKDDEMEEYEPNVDFKPVIPLPELVDLKTGEEEEEKAFGDRARLYRFDQDINQWKERGVGELKLLLNKKNNRCRLLMRREQVLKLCANHFLSQDMKLTPMHASDKAWCWMAQDFAEEELRFEKFAAKFKTAEVAEQFREAFERCRDLSPVIIQSPGNSGKKEAETTSSTVETEKKEKETTSASGSASLPPLSQIFKVKKGSWECGCCCIINVESALQCIACSTLKPGVKHEDVQPSSKSVINTDCITQTGFKFDASSSSAATTDSGFTFTAENIGFGLSSTTAASTPVFSTDSSGFTFTPMPTSASTSNSSSSGFVFSNETANVFGKTAPSTPITVAAKPDPPQQNSTTVPLYELFKAKPDDWECSVCLVQCNATQQQCPACTTPKPGAPTSPFNSSKSGFSFQANETANVFGKTATSTPITMAAKPDPPQQNSTTVPLYELFKAKPDDWECSVCLVQCNATQQQCPACMTPKPDVPTSSFNSSKSGFSFQANETANVFGKTATSTPITVAAKPDPPQQNSTTVPLRELFKAKPDDWECSVCLVQCNATQQQCPACTTPKPGAPTSPFNSSKSGFSFQASTTNNTFVFGSSSSESKSSSDKEAGQKDKNIFGTPSTLSSGSENKPPNAFNFTQSSSLAPSTIQPAALGSPINFEFTFKPSPTPGKGILGPGPTSAALNPASGSSSTQSLFPFSLTATPGQTPKCEESKPLEVGDDGYYVNKDGEDSHIYFEPVVPLPEKVEVKTGEEDEVCLFEHRAKLYRFAGCEWKERGIGNIKILENLQTKKLRIVMRREQVLKVCCNHYITTDLDLKPMYQSNGKVWVWYAMDSSDGGEPTHQQLSIRFKNAEIASDFKKAFDHAKQKAAAYAAESSMSKDKSDDDTLSPVSKPEDPKETIKSKSPLSRQLFTNSSEQEDDVIFVSKTEATPEQIKKAHHFLLPDHFYLYETKAPCSGCRGCDPEDLKNIPQAKSPSTAKPFEPRAVEKSKPSEETFFAEPTSTSPLFSSFISDGSNPLFQTPSTELLFSTLAAQADTMEKPVFQKDASKPFTWQGAGQKLFGASTDSPPADGDGDDVVQSQDIHFEPAIPLPALVEHKSGEEDETPVFIERAKLFRFDQNQWKEKGIGSMKILKHKTDLRYRLLLRREQVLKLACNHILTPTLKLKPLDTSETSWCWTACDYTDSAEGEVELFAIKFKTIKIASQFKKCFLECQEILRIAETEGQPKQSESNIIELEKSIKQLIVEQNTDGADADEDEEEDDDDVEEDEEEDDEEDDDEDYEEEEEEEEVEEEEEEEEYQLMFEEKATLSYLEENKCEVAGMGNLLVVTDDDVSGLRIRMKADNSNLICNHMITRETHLKQLLEKNAGTWFAMDYSVDEPVKRTFKVEFSSVEVYSEFEKVIERGKELAMESEISEHSIPQSD